MESLHFNLILASRYSPQISQLNGIPAESSRVLEYRSFSRQQIGRTLL